MASKTFDLEFPFEHRGTQHTQFTLRSPKVRDLRGFLKAAEADPVTAIEKTIANLSEVDEKVISEMELADFFKIKNWFEAFLEDAKKDLAA